MICRNKGVPSDLLLEIQNTLSLGGGVIFINLNYDLHNWNSQDYHYSTTDGICFVNLIERCGPNFFFIDVIVPCQDSKDHVFVC
jgi:hypothetical protein